MRSALLAPIFLLLCAMPARAELTITNGGTWSLDSNVKVTACLAGHCASDKASQSDQVSLPSGTVVQIMLDVFGCGGIALEDYCDLKPGRRGKLKLVKCDKSAIAPLLRDCSPYPQFQLRRAGGFEQMGEDGQSFRWRGAVSFNVRAAGHTVAVRASATVDGTLIAPELQTGDAVPALDLRPLAPALIDAVVGKALATASH